MGWSMNELYSQMHSSSIMESYNNIRKNGYSLIKKAQNYSKHLRIFKYARKIFAVSENDYVMPYNNIRINIQTAGKYGQFLTYL